MRQRRIVLDNALVDMWVVRGTLIDVGLRLCNFFSHFDFR
jgi:hypothetical protein